MQAISKGLEKVVQELTASENEGPVSETFCWVILIYQLVILHINGVSAHLCVAWISAGNGCISVRGHHKP